MPGADERLREGVAERRDITAKKGGRRTTRERRECWKRKKKKRKKNGRQTEEEKKEKKEQDGNDRHVKFFERSRPFDFAHGGRCIDAERIDSSQVWKDRKAALQDVYTRRGLSHSQLDFAYQEPQGLLRSVSLLSPSFAVSSPLFFERMDCGKNKQD